MIIKKAGNLEDYQPDKILSAVSKSAERVEGKRYLDEREQNALITEVENLMSIEGKENVPVESMHAYVITALNKIRPDVGKQYADYHFMQKYMANMFQSIREQTASLLYRGDRANANADSKLASTISCLSAGYLGTEMFKERFLTNDEMKAVRTGFIKVHDMDKREIYSFNCCLFDVGALLKGGFEMSNIWYNEPKSLDVAFDVIGDIVLSAASQQYGGFTIPEVDKILAPYAEKTYQKLVKKYIDMGVEESIAESNALSDVQKDMRQGFQGWEYKLNTVASSRGDYPFVTVTAGLATDRFGIMATEQLLAVRAEGQGKEGFKRPVLFPKIVFLYDEALHGKGGCLENLFEAGISCSQKAMYPDWLSLTGEGYVASIYKKYKKAISPMGCRAFLSPWYERGGMEPADEEDTPVFVGRFNIGVVSLHLPLIYAEAERQSKDFFELLDYYLNMIRNIHIRTYKKLAEMPAHRDPLGFCEGGLYGGHLRFDQKLKDNPVILQSATASFGITALNELQMLHNGKSIREDGEFALETMRYINDKVAEFKKEDHHLYAIYGTPAESLCGLQVQQFRAAFGIVEGVSDREYVSNSFHCHVTEQMSPIEKQDKEARFWDLCNGGKIQYVKYPNSYNRNAIRTLVTRAMHLGLYEGVNLALSYCNQCGHQSQDIEDNERCPVCGSTDLTKIDRMNGYLAYSREKNSKTSRLNYAKMCEIKDRVSM
jgi:ribonucleoside-triphosphate reductase